MIKEANNKRWYYIYMKSRKDQTTVIESGWVVEIQGWERQLSTKDHERNLSLIDRWKMIQNEENVPNLHCDGSYISACNYQDSAGCAFKMSKFYCM